MSIVVKICGINTPETLITAIQGGAHYIGLVFYPHSPRSVSVPQAIKLTHHHVFSSYTAKKVALFVNPSDNLLKKVIPQVQPNIIQLHGTESPQRTASIRKNFGIPILKAIPLRVQEDLQNIVKYTEYVDYLLFDAKPPQNSNSLPGGNGIPFDWSLLKNQKVPLPWFLSGGLNVNNLTQAISQTNAQMVDVSSGVEDTPGHKSQHKILAFLTKASSIPNDNDSPNPPDK